MGGTAASGCLLFVYQHHLGPAPDPPGPTGPAPAPTRALSPVADSGAQPGLLPTPTLKQSQTPLSPARWAEWEDPHASLGLFISARTGEQHTRLSSNSFRSVLPAVFAFYSRVFGETTCPPNPFLPVIFVIYMGVFSLKLGLML